MSPEHLVVLQSIKVLKTQHNTTKIKMKNKMKKTPNHNNPLDVSQWTVSQGYRSQLKELPMTEARLFE